MRGHFLNSEISYFIIPISYVKLLKVILFSTSKAFTFSREINVCLKVWIFKEYESDLPYYYDKVISITYLYDTVRIIKMAS